MRARLAADDQQRLGVGLQPGDAVDHVAAGVLQPPGPADVAGLVEAGLQLDQHGDLLAVLGRPLQGPMIGESPLVR